MPYAVQQDAIDARGETLVLSVASTNDGRLDSTKITNALAAADGFIDGYLRASGLTVPLTTIPTDVQRCSVDLAIYDMSEPGKGQTENVIKRRDDWVKWLQSIAAGKVDIGVASASAAASPDATADMQSEDRVMSRSSLAGLL